MKTIISFVILFLSGISIGQTKFIYNNDAIINEQTKKFSSKINYADNFLPAITITDAYVITLAELNVNGRTYYDIQSNGICRMIFQQNSNPNYIHAVFMVDPIGAAGFPDRRTKYFHTTNGGANWEFLGNVPSIRSGFPSITLMNDGRAVILNHTTDGGTEQRTQLYIDIAPGAGSFSRLDPGAPFISGYQPIWPIGFSTLSNKIVFIGSPNNISDSSYRNLCTGLNTPGIFTGYTQISGSENISYSIARSGIKIGIVYVTSENSPAGGGCVRLIESLNDGVSWSSPVSVYNIGNDSLVCIRSVDLAYIGSIPKVIFALAHVDQNGNYFPKLFSKMMFWSPDVNGGAAKMIDSAGGLTGSLATDVYYSVCRGVIGASSDGTALYAAWARARSDTNTWGVNYFDIYMSYSIDWGATWISKIKLTNNSGPLRDCRYPSISPSNHISAGNYFVHIIYLQDSIPGSFVQGQEMSLARMMYAKINLGNIFVGVNKFKTEVPQKFHLSQNYPNPFNPTTNIRFDLPPSPQGEGLGVRVIIYDILGREIQTLVNEQLSPGTYEVEFDGTNYSSGVYYYSLIAGEFTQTKRMVLIK